MSWSTRENSENLYNRSSTWATVVLILFYWLYLTIISRMSFKVNPHSIVHTHRPVWLNGWVFIYELSGCEFESRCCHYFIDSQQIFAVSESSRLAWSRPATARECTFCIFHSLRADNYLTVYLNALFLWPRITLFVLSKVPIFLDSKSS